MDWAAHLTRILAKLGEDMAYTPPAGGAATTVRGMFVRPYDTVLGMASSNPSVACMTADVPGIAKGAAFTIAGTAYTVASIEPEVVAGYTLAQLDVS